jgi:hypothetical protein
VAIRNKKAVSEMVSYAIMIIIAITMSLLVYSFLYDKIPKFEKAECPDDVSLYLERVDCDFTNKVLTIYLRNSGFFTIDGIYARLHPLDSEITNYLIFQTEDAYTPIDNFKPTNDHYSLSLTISPTISSGNYNLKLIPVYFDSEKEDKSICNKAEITRQISCS